MSRDPILLYNVLQVTILQVMEILWQNNHHTINSVMLVDKNTHEENLSEH